MHSDDIRKVIALKVNDVMLTSYVYRSPIKTTSRHIYIYNSCVNEYFEVGSHFCACINYCRMRL